MEFVSLVSLSSSIVFGNLLLFRESSSGRGFDFESAPSQLPPVFLRDVRGVDVLLGDGVGLNDSPISPL